MSLREISPWKAHRQASEVAWHERGCMRAHEVGPQLNPPDVGSGRRTAPVRAGGLAISPALLLSRLSRPLGQEGVSSLCLS